MSTREKPLLVLQVNLGPAVGMVGMGVFKDDTANTVAERVIRESAAKFASTQEQRLKTRELAHVLEVRINQRIAEIQADMKKQKLEMRKVEFQMAQLQREKRLEQAAKNPGTMNIEKRIAQKEQKKEARVIGNLSIIVGPNRRGDIVVREGDDLRVLVKNFTALYGLKKEVAPTIHDSLVQLVQQNTYRTQQME